jgi:hypothetical protein
MSEFGNGVTTCDRAKKGRVRLLYLKSHKLPSDRLCRSSWAGSARPECGSTSGTSSAFLKYLLNRFAKL